MGTKHKKSNSRNIDTHSMRNKDDYEYQLVQFTESAQNDVMNVDIVPSKWIVWDTARQVLMTKYPSPPYTNKTFAQLHNIVKGKKDPIDAWPLWAVEIKGGADTYKEALRRLEKLRTDDFAWTTDAERPQQKAQTIKNKLAEKSTKDLFHVPELPDDESRAKIMIAGSSSGSKVSSMMENTGASQKTKKNPCTKFPKKKTAVLQDSSSETTRSKNSFSSEPSGNETDVSNTPSCKAKGASAISLSKQVSQRSMEVSRRPNVTSQRMYTTSDPVPKAVSRPTAFNESTDGTKYSADTIFLARLIKGIAIDVQDNTVALNAIRDAVGSECGADKARSTVENLEKEFSLNLPFSTIDAFLEFDQSLQDDDDLSKKLVLSLRQLFDRANNMNRSVTTIFRKFFTQDTIANCTAKKQVANKTLLKSTKFCQCMTDALTNYHTQADGTPVKPEDVLKSVGCAISNAKDWHGRRRQ